MLLKCAEIISIVLGVLLLSCSAPKQTTVLVTEPVWTRGSSDTKEVSGSEYRCEVKYERMTDQRFTFRIHFWNSSHSQMMVFSTMSAHLEVEGCEGFLNPVEYLSPKIDPLSNAEILLQFKVRDDSALPCFANGSRLILSGLTLESSGGTKDIVGMSFQAEQIGN